MANGSAATASRSFLSQAASRPINEPSLEKRPAREQIPNFLHLHTRLCGADAPETGRRGFGMGVA